MKLGRKVLKSTPCILTIIVFF